MEFIVYFKNIGPDTLSSLNIVIGKDCKVADGVKIWHGVSLTGNTRICEGVEITTNSVLENAIVHENVHIKSSYIEDSEIGENCQVGPFSHIRGGSKLEANCRVGNFVEIKNAQIGAGSKMAHLAYIGDATIGKNCNIGCGVIFCNYNGKIKQRSVLGDDVFVGSNTNLIAPLNIGDGAYIAGGSTITQNILPKEFAIARSRQTNKTNFKNPYTDR